MDAWQSILDVFLLLAAALVFGALLERIRLNAILGFLLAGTLLGPNAFQVMSPGPLVDVMAQLGVALLLVTIGLEFSWRDMKRMGAIALGGGTAQVVVTTAVFAMVGIALGIDWRAAVCLGTMLAQSGTAFMLRLLVSRAEIDSIHGRSAVGMSLIQDMGVVPLVLFFSVLAGVDAGSTVLIALVRSIVIGALLVAAFFVIFRYAVPWLLSQQLLARNRDMPVLLAAVAVMGASWAATALNFSSALGAFVAGIVLGSSPFATQIRADLAGFRILFVTLFFTSVGMLAEPEWAMQNFGYVLLMLVLILTAKAVIAAVIAILFRTPVRHAIAAAICIAQVGEFAIVLARVGGDLSIIDDDTFRLVVSVTIGSFLITPLLVWMALPVGGFFERRLRRGSASRAGEVAADESTSLRDHVVILGFGPAGQRVAESLMREYASRVVVVELNYKNAQTAASYGLRYVIGDASQEDVLHSASVQTARVVAITLPDPRIGRQVISTARSMAPNATIIVRSRYHVLRWEFTFAGADVVVDEEDQVGRRIAAEVRRVLHELGDEQPEPSAAPQGS